MLVLAVLVLTGCTSEASSISRAQDKGENTDVVDTGFTLTTVGSYDSADTAVVLSTDLNNKAVSLINMDTGKQYTLYYDGTTYVQDKHDGPMTISQIKAGDVVDVTFLKGKKRLASIKKSPEAWVYDDVYNYDLTGANGTASIGSQTYAMREGVVVLSDGKRVDKAEVVSQDVVTISGIDHKIYSVNVDKGHGYLSLKNEQPLIGGWIEVGNSIIRQITEDMLLVVPEGSYQVVLSNNNMGCVKEVTVERNKEVILDVSDLEVAEDAVGKILFTVEPESATVGVDGKPVDISKAVELKYGIHQIQAEANGYDTLTKHIQVGSEYATISFKLEESRKDDGRDSVSGNSTTPERIPWKDTMDSVSANGLNRDSLSSNTLSSLSENALKSSQNGRVDVIVKDVDTDRELEKVTVRLEMEDSNKKVISTRSKESPCSFAKDKNAHKYRFILSKDGYETKPFEPGLESYQKDETVYFYIRKKVSASSDEISPDIISAIATAVTNCSFINGIEAGISSEDNTWHLTASGKETVTNAATNAIQKVVGTEGIGSYYFKIDKALKYVSSLGNGDYKGTVSVTVNRSGYGEKTIPVEIIIKKKAVIVKPDTIDVLPGDTVDFEAHVKINGTEKNDASITWSMSGNNSPDTGFKTEGKPSTLTVASNESAERLTVIATYNDNGTELSGQAVVKIGNGKVIFTVSPANAVDIIGKAISKGTDQEEIPINFGGEPTELKYGYYTVQITAKVGEENYGCNKEILVDDDFIKKLVDGKYLLELKPEKDSKKMQSSMKLSEDNLTPLTSSEPPMSDENDNKNGEVQEETESGDTVDDSGENEDEDTEENLQTETVVVNKEAHPIRKWFSSLFK